MHQIGIDAGAFRAGFEGTEQPAAEFEKHCGASRPQVAAAEQFLPWRFGRELQLDEVGLRGILAKLVCGPEQPLAIR